MTQISPTALLEQFFEASRTKRVASFDVFDTALWRRVAQPTHIFALAERDLCQELGTEVGQDFAQARVDAESLARELGRREYGYVEVTLDEIYSVLPRFWRRSRTALLHARQAELKAEAGSVEPEPGIQQVYSRLKALKVTTIFVSDVYLGEQDVRNLLVACGYDGKDPLFVSSEHRRAKWDGSIWELVSERLDVLRADIVHIGDNRQVDVEAAIRAGVTAFHWPGRSRHHKAVAPVSRWIAPLSWLKAMNQAIAVSTADRELTWTQLGRSYGAVIYGAFLLWLAERVEVGIDHIYFCSRDGQILLNLWRELIEPHRRMPTASYLCVSRRTLMLPRLDELDSQAVEFLRSGAESRTVRTYLDRVYLLDNPEAVARAESLFGSLDTVIKSPQEFDALQGFFRSSRRELAQVAGRCRQMVDRYLEQEGLFAGGHRIIVDLGWRGNLQRSIVELLQKRNAPTLVSGVYYGLTREAGVNRGSAGWMEAMISNDFMDSQTDAQLRQMVSILEQLHAADHGSTVGYSVEEGRVAPLFRSNDIEQSQYSDSILPFQRAAATELRAIFAGKHSVTTEQLNANSAWAALVDLCLFPSLEEARMLGELRTLDGFEHSGSGVPVAAPLSQPSQEDAKAVLRQHTWISGSFRNWLAQFPEMRPILRDLADSQNLGQRWASQFGR